MADPRFIVNSLEERVLHQFPVNDLLSLKSIHSEAASDRQPLIKVNVIPA